MTIGEMIDSLGQAGIGMLLLVLSLPALIPIPGPVGMVLGTVIALVSLQLMVGARRLWLPGFVRRLTLPASSVIALADAAEPWLRRAERWLKPRRMLRLTGRMARVAMSLPLMAMGIALALPIPLGNVPPIASLVAFSLAFLTRDGAAVLVGLGLAVFTLGWMTGLILFGAEIISRASALIAW